LNLLPPVCENVSYINQDISSFIFHIYIKMEKQVTTYSTAQKSAVPTKWQDFAALVKFRLNITVVFSSVMAYLIAANGVVEWSVVAILALGGFFITGAANTINEVLEADFDVMMKRTENRPIAAGRMTREEGILWAGMMSLMGITLMSCFNLWAALFSVISLITYAFIYTPLKRVSPIAVTVGAVPGALPMLIGVVAYEGEVTALALVLFAIQFIWQFPHFWAIGWFLFDDYKKGGFFMLPTGKRDKGTAVQVILYTVWTILVSIVPAFGVTGGLYLSPVAAIIVGGLGLFMLYWAIKLYQKRDAPTAKKLMLSSVTYITLLQIVFVVDKFLR